MTTYWCANFVSDEGLEHGIEKNLWMMQYQYADSFGNEHEGNNKGTITRNWRQHEKVKPDDWLVAYVPENRNYAI